MASDGLNLVQDGAGNQIGAAFHRNGYVRPYENLKNVVGWSHTTRSINGDPSQRLSSQNGLQSYDPASLNIREPFRMGKFILKILKIPPFFDPAIAYYMRFILEDNVKQVSGIPSNSIETISQTNGATKIESDFPGNYKQSGKELSVQTIEYAGGVVRKFIDYWLRGISDSETTVSHLYGADLPFVRSSYSASFLYTILGPTARPTDIEFNAIFHECWPTKEIADYLSSNTLGDVGGVSDVEIPLTGIYQNAPEVDILGQVIAAGYGLYSESALNQTLPAYIYQTYFGATLGSAEFAQKISIQQHEKLKQNKLQDNSAYPADVQANRDKVLRAIWGSADTVNKIAEKYNYNKAFSSIGFDTQNKDS